MPPILRKDLRGGCYLFRPAVKFVTTVTEGLTLASTSVINRFEALYRIREVCPVVFSPYWTTSIMLTTWLKSRDVAVTVIL
jgi:hypothetical protein